MPANWPTIYTGAAVNGDVRDVVTNEQVVLLSGWIDQGAPLEVGWFVFGSTDP